MHTHKIKNNSNTSEWDREVVSRSLFLQNPGFYSQHLQGNSRVTPVPGTHIEHRQTCRQAIHTHKNTFIFLNVKDVKCNNVNVKNVTNIKTKMQQTDRGPNCASKKSCVIN